MTAFKFSLICCFFLGVATMGCENDNAERMMVSDSDTQELEDSDTQETWYDSSRSSSEIDVENDTSQGLILDSEYMSQDTDLCKPCDEKDTEFGCNEDQVCAPQWNGDMLCVYDYLGEYDVKYVESINWQEDCKVPGEFRHTSYSSSVWTTCDCKCNGEWGCTFIGNS